MCRNNGGNGTDRAVLGFLPENIPSYHVQKVASVPFNNRLSFNILPIFCAETMAIISGKPSGTAITIIITEDETKAMDFLNAYKVFRGTIVCSGNGVMEVTTVGDKSVYGKIASELQMDDDRESPLKVKLTNLANGSPFR